MPGLREVPIDVSFPALEREVLARWIREGTFERSIAARVGAPEYVFYDGPPFATGLPHYGHILTSYIKDVVPRYFTMRGHHVPRRWGWDCHGLPVEVEIEKELGFRSRADIVAYGVGRFNDACRTAVLRYADEWRTIMRRLGRWVDFDNDYKTMDPDYMESVVWVFRALWDRGLIYEGNKVVPYCTRCQTTLSNFESRQDDAFRSRQDPAVTVGFRRADRPGEAFLAWTTTPWTLPSNVALAVGADIEYSAMAKGGDTVWLARAALPRYERELAGYVERERMRGRDLIGVRFEPLLPYFADLASAGAFRVLAGDFVTTEDGTGIVHLAPAFGEDDAALCAAAGIEGPNPVGDDGAFDVRVADFAGQHVFAANPHLIRFLKDRGAVFSHETIEHSYPHCWRCDQPLIYRAIRTWFVEVTKVKEQMLAANAKVSWVPEHIRDGRFGNWLANARDWAISRNRFWGAPIPVWRCAACAALEVIGSRAELERRSGRPLADWHRPAIDGHTWSCVCGGLMTRIGDVLDCWFESGSMPYAQVHYPVEHKAEFEASFPGDFIVEYVAQTRGWFYTMVVLAAALFDGPPFRNVVCHGVILAEDGRKMSKRLKNYPDPMELVELHGSDALRAALLSSPVVQGADLRFSARSVHDAVRDVCIPLWNSLHYFTAYAAIDGFEPRGELPAPTRLDRHLLGETERLRAGVEERMAVYDFVGCYELLRGHIDMLSRWYIRLSKPRLWSAGPSDDKRSAYEALYASLSTLARVMAPFLPFLAESVHQALGGERSVHLEDWPAPRPDWRADDIAEEMRAVQTVVRLARSVREAQGIKHRHPLRSVAVAGLPAAAVAHNLELLTEELNVKEVRAVADPAAFVTRVVKLDYTRLGKRLRGDVKKVAAAVAAGDYTVDEGGRLHSAGVVLEPEDFSFRFQPRVEGTGVAAEEDLVVVLDLATDPALIAEGQMRDLNRGLQDLRKQAGLPYADRIGVSVQCSPALAQVVAAYQPWLCEQTLAVALDTAPMAEALARAEIDVGEEKVTIALRRSPGSTAE